LNKSFDDVHGGFGTSPKFPRPSILKLLMHLGARDGDEGSKTMVTTTLEHMARGGLYDHVGGGFTRYSTDRQWLVPHFEKMLYDNAQLIDAYVSASLWLDRPDFADVARDVLTFIKREMTDKLGGFYSAQDADSEGEEGRFYVFTLADLKAALGEENATFAARTYGATESGNFEHSNILHLKEPLEAIAKREALPLPELKVRLEKIRSDLYQWREKRVRPGLDDKVLASWNGMMISACARAGRILKDKSVLAMAERAAAFVRTNLLTKDGQLLRRYRDGDARFEASLDDYAFLGLGFLSLFEATGEVDYLTDSLRLSESMEARFKDPDSGGFFFAEPRPDLVVRMKESYDGAIPSANSAAALLLGRLGTVLHRDALRVRAQEVAGSFLEAVTRVPEGYPMMLIAAAEVAEAPRTLFVVGDRGTQAFEECLERAHRNWLPGRRIIPVVSDSRAALEALGLPVDGKVAPAKEAKSYLCEDGVCRPTE
jgi:uncharacterized protein YyaL (SSP411 family)